MSNQNITQTCKEIFLDSKALLISHTDEYGIIKFVNDDFCKITGYTMEELIGKSHNILRHSYMPSSAFKELWDTIKKGNVWTGYLKNKTKNGDFFWVYATIYPFVNSFGVKGYTACRRRAASFEIEQIKILYSSDFYS
jgi:aerotaxis receptor